MNDTQKNIEHNAKVVIIAFNEEWISLRIFGKGQSYTDGQYYDFCNKICFLNGEVTPCEATKPKVAIVIKADKMEELK